MSKFVVLIGENAWQLMITCMASLRDPQVTRAPGMRSLTKSEDDSSNPCLGLQCLPVPGIKESSCFITTISYV